MDNYNILLKVDMSTWIVDILDMKESFKEYLPNRLYYGQFVELFENNLVSKEQIGNVRKLLSMSAIKAGIKNPQREYKAYLICKEDEHYTRCVMRFCQLDDEKSDKLLVFLMKIRDTVSDTNSISILEDEVQSTILQMPISKAKMCDLMHNEFCFVLSIIVNSGEYQFIDCFHKKMKVYVGKNIDEVDKDPKLRKWRALFEQIKLHLPQSRFKESNRLRTTKVAQSVFQTKDDEGTEIWVSCSISYFEGEEPVIFVMGRDYDDEVKTVNVLKAQNQLLKNSLHDGKEWLSAKNSFVKKLADDVLLPLNYVQNCVKELQQNSIIGSSEKLFEIEKKIEQSKSLLLGMKNMSILEEDNWKNNIVIKDMRELIDHINLIIIGISGAKQIQYHVKQGMISHKKVKIDEYHFVQIMLNILLDIVHSQSVGSDFQLTIEEQKTFGFGKTIFIFKVNRVVNGYGLKIAKYIAEKMGSNVVIEVANGEIIVLFRCELAK